MTNTLTNNHNDKFIAIDVTCGDAFYLQRNGINILVDGGKNKKDFPNLLKSRVGDIDLDIIVCTHCDSDHVHGLLGYFVSGGKSKETWLPGSWSHRLDDLIYAPEEFAKELYHDINIYFEENDATNSITLQEIGNIMSNNKSENPGQQDKENSSIEKYLKKENHEHKEVDLKSKTIASIKVLSNMLSNPKRKILRSSVENNIQRIFESAIHSAVKILKLSSLAYNAGSKIRWFEYSNNDSYGGEKYLHPVNSKEILSYTKNISSLMYLALTKANVESLVFYSPAIGSNSGVLFTADSNFTFNHELDFIQSNSIITSPHHGSESNKNTYGRLYAHIDKFNIFIRSDMNGKSRPGKSYLNLKQKKYCTICRGSGSKKHIKFFYSELKEWETKSATCICK